MCRNKSHYEEFKRRKNTHTHSHSHRLIHMANFLHCLHSIQHTINITITCWLFISLFRRCIHVCIFRVFFHSIHSVFVCVGLFLFEENAHFIQTYLLRAQIADNCEAYETICTHVYMSSLVIHCTKRKKRIIKLNRGSILWYNYTYGYISIHKQLIQEILLLLV